MNFDPSSYKLDQLAPFMKNGVILDTSVLRVFLEGFVSLKFSNKSITDYQTLLGLFQRLKINVNLENFVITPHVLSEVCRFVQMNFSGPRFREIVEEIFPYMQNLQENLVSKKQILENIDLENPVIEIGDISIHAMTRDWIDSNKKVAIISNDWPLLQQYVDHPKVLVLHFDTIKFNLQ